MVTRRGFLTSLTAFAAAAVLDPERLLWRPGTKSIFIPTAAPVGEALFTVPAQFGFIQIAGLSTLEFHPRTYVYEPRRRTIVNNVFQPGDTAVGGAGQLFEYVQYLGEIPPRGQCVVFVDRAKHIVAPCTGEGGLHYAAMAGVVI